MMESRVAAAPLMSKMKNKAKGSSNREMNPFDVGAIAVVILIRPSFKGVKTRVECTPAFNTSGR